MTLMFLVRSLNAGGAERQLLVLARELVKRDHRVIVATFYGDGDLDQDFLDAGIELVNLDKTGRWSFGFVRRLTQLIRQERPDVLHSYLVVPNFIAAAMKLAFPSLPVVWGIRAAQMDLSRFDYLARLTFRLQGLVTRIPNLIIYNSLAGKDYHESLGYKADNAIMIPNGIDVQKFQPQPESRAQFRSNWQIPEDAPVFGLPARIDPVKGHDLFLNAAQHVLQFLPEARFVCIGDGDQSLLTDLKSQAQTLGLSGRMIWTGHCIDMTQAYAGLDVACLPSLGEGFPNVIAEAMACNVPCVVSAVGDAAEILGPTGCIVAERSPQAFATALCKVYNQTATAPPDAQNETRQRIVDNYSPATLADRTVNALQQLTPSGKFQSLNILFPFVGDTIGGSHHSAVYLMQELTKQGHRPVATVHTPGPLVEFLHNHNITMAEPTGLPVWNAEASTARNFLSWLQVNWSTYRYLRKHKADLIHVNDGRMTLSWTLAAKLARVPCLVHQRTKFHPSRLTRLALQLSPLILTISDYVRSTLPGNLKGKSAVVANPFPTPQALDKAEARTALVNELNLDPEKPLLVCLGTLQAQKRQHIALEAINLLRAQGVTAQIVFAGRDTSAYAQELKQQSTDLGLTKSVHIVGFRSDVANLLAAADLVVAPAVNEGHGRTLIEAMFMDTPVIAAASGGHLEIVDKDTNGLLISPDSPEDLAFAVDKLLHRPELGQNLASTAKAFVTDSFSPTKHAQSIMQHYACALDVTDDQAITIVIESMGGGGAQNVVSGLLHHWTQAGRHVDLITLQGENHDKFTIPAAVQRHVIGGSGASATPVHAIISNLKRLCALRNAIRRSCGHSVIAFVTTTNILTMLAGFGLRRRFIISERNDPKRQALSRPWQVLRKWTYPMADVVTANSQAALQTLSKLCHLKQTACLPNPLRQLSQDVAHDNPAPTILAVGRLHPQKSYDLLLKAFAKARPEIPEWRLQILGTGALEAELKAMAQDLKISDAVAFVGFASDPAPYYCGADLFVMTSAYEGSPNALWEAMSCGVPAIVADTLDGALEIVADGVNGCVVPHGDVEALAQAMSQLAADPKTRNTYGQRGQQAMSAFAPDMVFQAWDHAIWDLALFQIDRDR